MAYPTLFEKLAAARIMIPGPGAKRLVFNGDLLSGFPLERKTKIRELHWILGAWNAHNHVYATPTTPAYTDVIPYRYSLSADECWILITNPAGVTRPVLTYDPFSRRFMMVLSEAAYGVLTSPGPAGVTFVFTGAVSMIGIDCVLRHTFTRGTESEFRAANEEQLPDGSWTPIDEFHYLRTQV